MAASRLVLRSRATDRQHRGALLVRAIRSWRSALPLCRLPTAETTSVPSRREHQCASSRDPRDHGLLLWAMC